MSDVPHDDIHPNPENVDPTQLGDLDDPAVPAPIAPCGCTNVTKCRAHGHPKPLTGTGKLTKLDAEGKPIGESMTLGNVSIDITPHDLPDAEAHEIMQRVTGQTQYPGMSEVAAALAQSVRDDLADARLPVPPFPGAGEALRSAIGSGQVHVPGQLDWVASEANRLWAASPPLAAFEEFLGQQHLRNARQDEASLRAMGATGPGDLLFELDMPDGLSSGGVDRLRVLLTGMPKVAVELATQDGLTKWSEITAGIGKAMADCAKSIRELVEAWQRSFDPETGETLPPPRRTTLVTCGHCQRDLFEQEADGSQVVEKYATDWSWQAGEPICKPGDHDGCQS